MPFQDPKFVPDEIQDPKFIPDEIQDPKFIPDKKQGIDYGKSLMKFVTEGIPPIDLMNPLSRLTDQDENATLPIPVPWSPVPSQVSAGALKYPAGVAEEFWNRGLKPLTSLPNLGLAALSIAMPASIPITSAVFGADMLSKVPEQVMTAKEAGDKYGYGSKEFWTAAGDAGLNAALAAGAVHGGGAAYRKRIPDPTAFHPERMKFEDYRAPRDINPNAIVPNYNPPINVDVSIIKPGQKQLGPGEAQIEPPISPVEIDPGITAMMNGVNRGTPESIAASIQRNIEIIAENRRKTAATQIPFIPEITKPNKFSSAFQSEVIGGGDPFDSIDFPRRKEEGTIPDEWKGLTNKEIGDEILERYRGPNYAINTARKNALTAIRDLQFKDPEASLAAFEEDAGYLDIFDEKYPGALAETDAIRNYLRLKAKSGEFLPPVEQSLVDPNMEGRAGLESPPEQSLTPPSLATIGDNVVGRDEFAPGFFRGVNPELVAPKKPNGPTIEGLTISPRVVAIWRSKMEKAGQPILPEGSKLMNSSQILDWQRGEAAKEFAESKAARERPIEQAPIEQTATEQTQQSEPNVNYIIRRDKATPEFIKQAQESGYEFRGLTDKGDYKFAKPRPIGLNDLLKEEGSPSRVGEKTQMDLGDRKAILNYTRATYKGAVPHIAGKELIQNALDAVMRDPQNGDVIVNINEPGRAISVSDNGPGLTREAIDTFYTDLTASGKRGGDLETVGEMGVGKTTYMLTGERVDIETVAIEADGNKYRLEFGGTPEEMMDPFDVKTTLVSNNTLTGTTVKLVVDPEQDFWSLFDYLNGLERYSTVKNPIKVFRETKDAHSGKITTSKIHSIIPKPANLVEIGKASTLGADITLSIPRDSYLKETQSIKLILNNRGMFQGTTEVFFNEKAKVPGVIQLDINPTVDGKHKDYPFTMPSRESLTYKANAAVKAVIKAELYDNAAKKRREELEKVFKNLVPLPGKRFALIDAEGRFTPDELARFANSRELDALANNMEVMLNHLTTVIPHLRRLGDVYSFGFILDRKVRGINIRNPNNHKEYSIFLNPIAILETANNPKQAADSFVHVMVHEFVHLMQRNEGADFTSALADVMNVFDLYRQFKFRKQFLHILENPHVAGSYNPKVQQLLLEAQGGMGRQGTGRIPLIAEEGSPVTSNRGPSGPTETSGSDGRKILDNLPVGRVILLRSSKTITQATKQLNDIKQLNAAGFKFLGENDQGDLRFKKMAPGPPKPPNKPPNEPPINTPPIQPMSPSSKPIIIRMKDTPPKQAGIIREVWNLSRGLMPVDLPFITSAGLRQGILTIGTKAWFQAWMPSVKAYGSKAAFEAHAALLRADPLTQRRTTTVNRKDGSPFITKAGQPVLKEIPSIAEEAGIKLTDLTSLTTREESIRSQLAERIPVYGHVVAANNRAYTAYINDLRLATFRNFYGAMPNKNDIVALKELGDAVNTFTGSGSLKTKVPFTGGKELTIEKYASGLAEGFFAPKLVASRLQMLNPTNYIMTNPQVRKEYVKAMLRLAGAWATFAAIGTLVGGKVSLDPDSSDFLKIRFGNVRLDPGGGFQQFLVFMARMVSNKYTSSTTGRTQEMGVKFNSPTRGSVAQNFVSNKLHPSAKYFYDGAFANNNRQFGVFDRAVQMAVPMITGDMIDIYKQEPELLPFLAPIMSAGMGSQYYTGQKGEMNKPMFIPRKNDITLGGR